MNERLGPAIMKNKPEGFGQSKSMDKRLMRVREGVELDELRQMVELRLRPALERHADDGILTVTGAVLAVHDVFDEIASMVSYDIARGDDMGT
jgi:hypothetical protein